MMSSAIMHPISDIGAKKIEVSVQEETSRAKRDTSHSDKYQLVKENG